MNGQPVQLQTHTPAKAEEEREQLIRWAKFLAWIGLGWHGIEATIAVTAGIVAGSIALIGFGADSLIEAIAGIVILWRFTAARSVSEEAERRAQKLVALSFYLLAFYIGVEALRALFSGDRPDPSWVGIGLAIVTLITMPPLAIAKARIGKRLASSATKSEGQQNMLCAYLSAALLLGLTANAFFGLWWADPVTGLIIAGVAVKEGRESWQGESCCTVPLPNSSGAQCEEDCCPKVTQWKEHERQGL